MPRTRLSWFFFLYKRLCCFFKNILHAWMCQRKSIMAKVEVGERGQFRKIHAGFERAVGSSRATVLLSLLFSDFFFFFFLSLSFFLFEITALVFGFFFFTFCVVYSFFFLFQHLLFYLAVVCVDLYRMEAASQTRKAAAIEIQNKLNDCFSSFARLLARPRFVLMGFPKHEKFSVKKIKNRGDKE